MTLSTIITFIEHRTLLVKIMYVLVLKICVLNIGMHVSVNEVLVLPRGESNDKASGMDELSGECLKFTDLILTSAINFILFN